jgi:hypothetical protein
MKIEIDNGLLQELTAAELGRTLESLQKDYKDRKAGKSISIFSTDKKEDLAQLKEHIEAFKLVLRYYT